MLRNLFVAILCCGILPQIVAGAPIYLIDGLPSSYTPGQPVMFDVRLPAISNLGSFNIDLVLEGDVGAAGTDFYFDGTATTPASTNYVFPTAANFFHAVNVDSPTRHRITLTDFDFTGINVVPGENDRVASIVFQTASDFAGHLSLAIDTDGLILDTPDIDPTPIPGFDALLAGVAESGPTELEPVPEPSTVVLMFLVATGVCLHGRHPAL